MTGSTVNQINSVVGKIGRYPYDGPALINQRVGKIYVKDPKIANEDYVYYFLNRFEIQYNLAINASGSANQANISPDQIKAIDIILPSIPTQNSIAEILSSLDDKIELNNKINKNLEDLAQALFKQWFVNFEFPNEKGEPYKSSGGEMVESESGEIPKGWKVTSLDQIANINIGRTPPRQEHHWFSDNPLDVKWISIRDMGNVGVYISETSEYITRDAIKKFNIPLIKPNTVIVSFKLTVGRVSITTETMLSNEAIAQIDITEKELKHEFVYLYLKQFNFDSLGSTSSIATAVNSKAIKALPIIHPNKILLNKFSDSVTELFLTIKNNYFETNNLSNLRDILLPKLISGELTVNEAVKEVAL